MTSNPRPGDYWTIDFLVRDGSVCLAEHTRGPGEGLRNGYGGKGRRPMPPAWSMQIETVTEAGVVPVRWEQRGWFDFYFNGLYVPAHIFVITDFLGEPRATEEMRDPQWYAQAEIPYDRMWQDDLYWLPRVLAGERLRGTIRVRDRVLEAVPRFDRA